MNNKKQRLLVLTSTFPRWPNDTDPPFVYELSKRLTNDFDVTVHAPHYPGSKNRENLEGIRVHRFRYCFAPFEKLAGSVGILPTLRKNKLFYCLVPLFLVAQFFSSLIIVFKRRPDVVHAHWLFPQGFHAVLLKIFFGIPVVVTAHGGDVYGLQSIMMKWLKGFVLHRANRITLVSSALRKEFLTEISTGKNNVIPMGVSEKIFSPGKLSSKIIKKYQLTDNSVLFVGRLTEKKGVQYLIEAMPKVLKRLPNTKLLIVGSGELESSLRSLVQKFSLQKNVVFVGGIPNSELPEYYASVKIFVGPSIKGEDGDTEGFGLTFVEAAFSGCVLIGSDVGGISDIIENNITGFLVPEKDSNAIAERIIYALDHNNEASVIARNARSKCIERFSWDNIYKRYLKILVEVCGKNARKIQ